MRSVTLKWILLSTAIIISLIVAMQLVWLSKQYTREQKEFTVNVVKSIRGLYEDFNIYGDYNLRNSIELPDKNSFLMRLDTVLDKQTILDSLSSELQQSDVFTDCKVAFYNAPAHKYLYKIYLPAAASHYPTNEGNEMPAFKRKFSYLFLFFPHRDKYILSQMVWWVISCVILILLLIGFAISLFYLYRQKFLNEVQNDFIRNVTHEFQTPLTTLTLGLDMLSKPATAAQPEKHSKYMKLMQGQTMYLKQHIENLMKVITTESKGLVIIKEKVVPNQLIKDAVVQLFASIDEKNAVIHYHLEDKNETITGDGNNLFVAILNVISNAVKYAKNPVIRLETISSSDAYIIRIKDNGIGIEKKYQQKLFKKFYRVPTGDLHTVKGLGLGLYFVKKVVDAHKGTITIESVPEIGTIFTISLPKH